MPPVASPLATPPAPPPAERGEQPPPARCHFLPAGGHHVRDHRRSSAQTRCRASAASNSWLNTVGLGALASPFCLVGIVFHLLGLAAWLWTLRIVPLTIAYCCTALQQATIAMGARLWLGEGITPLRWIGIALVCMGVLLLVPNIAASEQHDAKGEHAT